MIKNRSTKELLIESFLELSAKYPFDKISVTDIINNCGVSRKSFYNTFQDKYDLVEYIHAKSLENLQNQFINESPFLMAQNMVEYYKEHIAVYKSLSRSKHESIFQTIYRTSYNLTIKYILHKSNLKELPKDEAEVVSLHVHGIVTKMIEWINSPQSADVKDIAKYIVFSEPVCMQKRINLNIQSEYSIHKL